MTQTSTSLNSLLAGELTQMGEFIKLLEQEQSALTAGDTETLESLSSTKVALAQALNGVGEARNAILKRAGLPNDRLGVEAWIRSNPKDVAVQRLWNGLKAAVAEARELNLLNGKLIAMRLQHNQQALSALLSTSSPQNNLYGPDGQPTQLSGRRIIDAA